MFVMLGSRTTGNVNFKLLINQVMYDYKVEIPLTVMFLRSLMKAIQLFLLKCVEKKDRIAHSSFPTSSSSWENRNKNRKDKSLARRKK